MSPETAVLAHFNKGNSHYFLGEYEKAIESYVKAVDIDGDNADYHFNLANAY